jgi:hypothetical protein
MNKFAMNTRFDELLPRHLAKNVIPHLANKMGLSAELGCGHGLVGTLPTWI